MGQIKYLSTQEPFNMEDHPLMESTVVSSDHPHSDFKSAVPHSADICGNFRKILSFLCPK